MVYLRGTVNFSIEVYMCDGFGSQTPENPRISSVEKTNMPFFFDSTVLVYLSIAM